MRRRQRRKGIRKIKSGRKSQVIKVVSDADSGRVGNVAEYLERNQAEDVLVVRSIGGIGDLLMMGPGLRALKIRYPDCMLVVGVDRRQRSRDVYAQVLEGTWFIDQVVDAWKVTKQNFGYHVDLTAVCAPYEYPGAKPKTRIDLFAKSLGIQGEFDRSLAYVVTKEEQQQAFTYLDDKRDTRPLVFLDTSAMSPKRTWPVYHAYELIEETPECQFLVSDFNNEGQGWELFENCIGAPETTIREAVGLIEACDAFVGPDSGLMHLAAAVKTPAVVLFGSTPPASRIEFYPDHVGITALGLDCLGCWYQECPIEFRCMTELEAEPVRDTLLTILRKE